MRKMLISGAAFLLCAAAFPAAAAPAANQDTSPNNTQSESPGPQARNEGGNRRVCIRTALSNSRIARPVCRTQAEWDRMRRNGEFDND